ncbi:hypothetical protein BDQ12DRAFT_685654 [Crucibulum laeve]|uniref:Rhodanese domain-containing protein n=1 Tax=Crucibulum laeve TaxID=68775 RepID=A0A5C3LK91_9AGAR|nr:hypothetical protein BDQ12DRAFT_707501 [Crucibulum laeve]TFK37312.1 hypothetical protein BDQ12DRAFT_685654 [Crucibulum laeve]
MIGFRTVAPSSRASVSTRSESGTVTGISAENALILKESGTTQRTLEEITEQVARELAVRAITKARVSEGVKIGVSLTFSKRDNEAFLRNVSDFISHQLTFQNHLFAIATTPEFGSSDESMIIIFASSEEYLQRASMIISSKFIGRIILELTEGKKWLAIIHDIGTSPYDEDALWDVLEKSVKAPIDPLLPPPGSKGIDEILGETRAKLQRLSPIAAYDELRESKVGAPTFLVDIRPAAQREAEGEIAGALVIERNVLEWRFDPRCYAKLPMVDRYDLRIIIFCQEGYTSSLAAYTLHQIGMLNSTDIVGGYQAWKDAGLPVLLAKAERPELRSLVSMAGSVV